MQKVSIGFVGLSAAASSALVQSVVEQLAPEGVVMIDRDENGADITVFDEGERFLLPDAKLTVENGVATIESECLCAYCELVKEFEGIQFKSAVPPKLSDEDIAKIRKAFGGLNATSKVSHITAPITSSFGGSGSGIKLECDPTRFILLPDQAKMLIKLGRELEGVYPA